MGKLKLCKLFWVVLFNRVNNPPIQPIKPANIIITITVIIH